MARIFNNARIMNYNEVSGEIEIGWYDDAVPFTDQTPYIINHRIPEEFETEGWTRGELLQALAVELPVVVTIPQWMKDEADRTKGNWRFLPSVIPDA